MALWPLMKYTFFASLEIMMHMSEATHMTTTGHFGHLRLPSGCQKLLPILKFGVLCTHALRPKTICFRIFVTRGYIYQLLNLTVTLNKQTFLHRNLFVQLFTPIVKWTKIHVQIRRFACCLNMSFELENT